MRIYFGIITILSFVLSLVSCGNHSHVGNTAVADSLLTALSDMRYRNAAKLDTLSAELDSLSSGNNELRSVALNARGYSALMAMDYVRAAELYNEVLATTECEIERLVADVGLMTMCYRVSENRLFFDYRASALSRISRIDEDIDYLSDGDRQRFNRAKVEFDITSLCYFANLAMKDEHAKAMEQLQYDIENSDDSNLRLYARMLLANNTANPDERFSSLVTGVNIAKNRNISWLRGNYRLLLAITLRDTVQLRSFSLKYPEKVAQLLPHNVPVDELPFVLAEAATKDFSQYGDRYMMIEAMAVNASCYTQRARFYESLALLDIALSEIKSYYNRYYPEFSVMCENPLLFLDEEIELVTDIDSALYNIPECLLSVCREFSCAYAGVGDKASSDINREGYLELLRTTRTNKELESRASSAQAKADSLRLPMFVSLLLLFVLSMFLVYVQHRRNARKKGYSADRMRLLGVCRNLFSSLPREATTREELCTAVATYLNSEMAGFSGETYFSFSPVDDVNALPNVTSFAISGLDSNTADTLYVATSLPLSPAKKAIIEMLVPYIAVAVDEGQHLADISDEREKVVEQHAAHAIYLDEHKRENLLKRVSLSVVSGMRPFMDRIINELRVLDPSLPVADKRRKLEYVEELTEKLEDLNVILERWIKTRQGELNLRVENFQLSSMFDIISKREALLSARGITLDVKATASVVKADRALTLFMMNTLVDNAAKFTPKGGCVTLESIETDDYVEVAVTDTGVGMSQDDIDRIKGEKVYDASVIGKDNPLLSQKNKGGGFGLMNCKGIIEKYRKSDRMFSVCSLDIKSEKGHGSRFSFRLPKGVMRIVVLLLSLLPSNAFAGTYIFDRLNACADSVYRSNVDGHYEEAFVQANSALSLLNDYYSSVIGGVDTLTLSAGGSAELMWWRESLFPDSLREDIYYNILDIRNELSVASLALQRWDAYRYNNYIYSTLYRLVHEDKDIAGQYAGVQRRVDVQSAAIALSCFLILVLLLYYAISYVRHGVIEYTNERLVLEMNSRLLRLAAHGERKSVEELVGSYVECIYGCLGENMRIRNVAMMLRPDGQSQTVYAEYPHCTYAERTDIYMQSVLESGEEFVSANGLLRILPLYTTAGGERLLFGVLGIITERPLSDNEVVSIELVSGYLESVAYHSAVLVASGYKAIDELEEEAERVKFEENRMHVQNMVMDNCLSVIKHETIYYPGRVRELAAKALSNVENCGEQLVAMRELMDYYNSIFGILSNCAKRELDEMSFSLSSVELSSLFGRMTRFVERRSRKCGVDVKLVCEPVKSVVRADISLVEFLFESLLNAAMAYPVAGVLKLSAMEAGDFVKIELSDTRRELPSEELTDMFTPTRSNLAENGGIVGMEYLIAKEIVRLHEDYTGRHGGRMEARSDVSGTVIMFTLPK